MRMSSDLSTARPPLFRRLPFVNVNQQRVVQVER
jgi:hypothetical protein